VFIMSGASLVKTQGASGYTGKVTTYDIASAHASLLAQGDFVTITGTATAATGVAQVDASAAAGLITGVITGFAPNISNLEQKGLPASQAGSVLVQVDPDALYEIDISAQALTVADVGSNADIAATAATQSGNLVSSNMTIDGSTVAGAGATAQLRIVGLVPPTDGTVIGAIGNKALIRINESTAKGVVGV
jgi:hypothetical protein